MPVKNYLSKREILSKLREEDLSNYRVWVLRKILSSFKRDCTGDKEALLERLKTLKRDHQEITKFSLNLDATGEGRDYILLDKISPLKGTDRAHVDQDDDTLFDAQLRRTNAKGHDWSYRIQLCKIDEGANSPDERWRTWISWGRVGGKNRGQFVGDAGFFSEALGLFQAKFKEKTGHNWDDRNSPPKPEKYTYCSQGEE